MIKPQTIGKELADEISKFFSAERVMSTQDSDVIEFERRAKQLARVDVAEGYLQLAAISALCGDFGAMRSRYKIASNNGVEPLQKMNYAMVLSHVGFFSESGEIVRLAGKNCGDFYLAAERAISALHFRLATELYHEADRRSIELPGGDTITRAVIENLAADMTEHNIRDDAFAALADLAGQVMRDHSVFYNAAEKNAAFFSDENGPAWLCSSISVPVSFSEASDMNAELADKVVSSNSSLETSPFFIRFVGQYEQHA